MNQQKIFNFNLQNNYGNDDFFVSKSNELAHKILLNIQLAIVNKNLRFQNDKLKLINRTVK